MQFTSASQSLAYKAIKGNWEVWATHQAESAPHKVGVFSGTRSDAIHQARGPFLGCFGATLLDSVRWCPYRQEWIAVK